MKKYDLKKLNVKVTDIVSKRTFGINDIFL
jgi:hypothetical protein